MTDYKNIERRFVDGRIIRRDTNKIDAKMEDIISKLAAKLLWDLDELTYEQLNGVQLTDNKSHKLYEKLTSRLTKAVCTG
jgi:hypothetical protein